MTKLKIRGTLTLEQRAYSLVTDIRLLDVWTDILDGVSLYDVPMNSVVAGIDSTLERKVGLERSKPNACGEM